MKRRGKKTWPRKRYWDGRRRRSSELKEKRNRIKKIMRYWMRFNKGRERKEMRRL